MQLLRIAEGDEKAFELLFNRYYTHLSDFIFRITESNELTQEIVLDVFLKVWLNRSALLDVNYITSYLQVVARNHAFNHLKKLASEKKKEKVWIDSVIKQATDSTEEPTVFNAEVFVDTAVDMLPVQQKKVYLLAYRKGLKQKQIALQLGVSVETVKKHMGLAKKFLKKYLTTITTSLLTFFSLV